MSNQTLLESGEARNKLCEVLDTLLTLGYGGINPGWALSIGSVQSDDGLDVVTLSNVHNPQALQELLQASIESSQESDGVTAVVASLSAKLIAAGVPEDLIETLSVEGGAGLQLDLGQLDPELAKTVFKIVRDHQIECQGGSDAGTEADGAEADASAGENFDSSAGENFDSTLAQAGASGTTPTAHGL